MIASSELVFVPGVGFRSAGGSMLATPVTAEQGEWSITIERLVVDPQKTELIYALTGPGGEPLTGREDHPQPPSWMHLPVSLRSGDHLVELTNEGRQGPTGWSTGMGTGLRTVRPTLRFPPLLPTESVDVILDGAPGNWTIPVGLTSMTTYGLPAQPIDVSDTHHGVRLTARAIARSESMTAIDVETTLDPTPQPRFMRSLGARRYMRGMDPQLTLRDDCRLTVQEFAVFDDEVKSGRELHQVLVFPALSADASFATLEIPEIVLAESVETPLTLSVPFDGEVEFGTFVARASVTRSEGRRGKVVRVLLDDGGWTEGRRLLYPEQVRPDGRGSGVGFEGMPTPGQPCPVTGPDPEGNAREVTLYSPVLELRGPWRLELPL